MTASNLTYGWHPIALLALGSAAGLGAAPQRARTRSTAPAAAPSQAPTAPAPLPALVAPAPLSEIAGAPVSTPVLVVPAPRSRRSEELLGPISERMPPSQRARRAVVASLQA